MKDEEDKGFFISLCQILKFHEKKKPSLFLTYCSPPSTITVFHSTSQTTLFIISFRHSFHTVPGDLLFKIVPNTCKHMSIIDYYHKLVWTLKMLRLEE